MAELRLQVPGGRMTVQMLRDLVGWAGAAGSGTLRMGDAQDWIVEGASADPGPVPSGFRRSEAGSLQSSAFGPAPLAAVPWLTTGVWLDLLAELPEPGPLDVQLVAEPALGHFVRVPHVRLVAGRASHRWDLYLRRPGSDRVTARAAVATGDLVAEMRRALEAWTRGEGSYWEGPVATVPAVPRVESLEGWAPEGRETVRFGFGPAGGRVSLERLRDLTWRAAEAGTVRVSLTPGRVLLFEGLSEAEGRRWQPSLAAAGLIARHSDLDHAVVAAGTDVAALQARREVVEALQARDSLPPGPRLLVADHGLNRRDGVTSVPFPLLIRTPDSWLYRSGDGKRAGEGTLDEVLAALVKPTPLAAAATPQPPVDPVVPVAHSCPSCFTVFEPRFGDPRGGVPPGVAFADLPATWACPVCGLPGREW